MYQTLKSLISNNDDLTEGDEMLSIFCYIDLRQVS